MLHMALVFLVIGLIAALLGFTTIAGASIAIAKFLAGLFLVLFLVFLIIGLVGDTPHHRLTADTMEDLGSPRFSIELPHAFPSFVAAVACVARAGRRALESDPRRRPSLTLLSRDGRRAAAAHARQRPGVRRARRSRRARSS